MPPHTRPPQLLVSPRRAAAALEEELAVGLGCAAAAAATIWEAQVAGGGGACAPCRAAASSRVASEVSRLRASVARQRQLLVEAADEPDWSPLAFSSPQSAPRRAVPLRAGQAVEEAQARLLVLLGLMHAILAAAAGGGGAPLRTRDDENDSGPDSGSDALSLGRLVGPCAPALRLLLSRLRERYTATVDDLSRGRTGGRSDAAAARVAAAAAAFEARTCAAVVGLLRAHRAEHAPVVPSRILLPFVALCWCTRALARNADEIGVAAAALLGRGAEEAVAAAAGTSGLERGAEAPRRGADDAGGDDAEADEYGGGASGACPVCGKRRARGQP